MNRRILFVLLCVAFVFAISGCEFVASLFWPPVTLAQAQEAFAAIVMAMAAPTVDNGSTSTTIKVKDADGTVFLEFPATSTAGTMTLTCDGFEEAQSEYTLSGTLKITLNTSGDGDWVFDMDMDHASKPVKKVAGTLNQSGSTLDGTLKFNKDEFTFAELGSTA